MTHEETKWMRHKSVAEHLGLDARTLRELMRRTPSESRAWVNVGLGSRPRYRWESLAAADAWLKSVDQSHVEA